MALSCFATSNCLLYDLDNRRHVNVIRRLPWQRAESRSEHHRAIAGLNLDVLVRRQGKVSVHHCATLRSVSAERQIVRRIAREKPQDPTISASADNHDQDSQIGRLFILHRQDGQEFLAIADDTGDRSDYAPDEERQPDPKAHAMPHRLASPKIEGCAESEPFLKGFSSSIDLFSLVDFKGGEVGRQLLCVRCLRFLKIDHSTFDQPLGGICVATEPYQLFVDPLKLLVGACSEYYECIVQCGQQLRSVIGIRTRIKVPRVVEQIKNGIICQKRPYLAISPKLWRYRVKGGCNCTKVIVFYDIYQKAIVLVDERQIACNCKFSVDFKNIQFGIFGCLNDCCSQFSSCFLVFDISMLISKYIGDEGPIGSLIPHKFSRFGFIVQSDIPRTKILLNFAQSNLVGRGHSLVPRRSAIRGRRSTKLKNTQATVALRHCSSKLRARRVHNLPRAA